MFNINDNKNSTKIYQKALNDLINKMESDSESEKPNALLSNNNKESKKSDFNSEPEILQHLSSNNQRENNFIENKQSESEKSNGAWNQGDRDYAK